MEVMVLDPTMAQQWGRVLKVLLQWEVLEELLVVIVLLWVALMVGRSLVGLAQVSFHHLGCHLRVLWECHPLGHTRKPVVMGCLRLATYPRATPRHRLLLKVPLVGCIRECLITEVSESLGANCLNGFADYVIAENEMCRLLESTAAHVLLLPVLLLHFTCCRVFLQKW
uniref:Uncharacterized protein n=1 Tax=Opuntia streptacantha TaxID=393608 RepID=A0A7C9B156_OPUST